MKINRKVHVTKQGVIKRNPKTVYRIIAMKAFDWRESDDADKWISAQKNKGRDVYELDAGADDAIVLVTVKKGLGLQTVENVLREDLPQWTPLYDDGNVGTITKR